MSNFEKIIVVVLTFLLAAVTLLFTLQLRTNNLVKNLTNTTVSEIKNDSIPLSTNLDLNETIEKIDQKTEDLLASSSALTKRLEKLEEKPDTITSNNTNPNFQKQIIYIGSASTKENNWIDSGVEINLNSSDYPSGVNAVFEAGLSTVGGEAWARLINKTTGAVMDITEISHSTSTTTWKSSHSFNLFEGNNTYSLQIKSSSGEVANFSGARIVISK
jgi:hypothetical protein